MTKMYDQQFLKDTIYLLKGQIRDLGTWSVYNEDMYSYQVAELEKALKNLEKEIKEGLPY
jgi:hypothetical protein